MLPEFDADVTEYTVSVANTVSLINITVEANHEGATVEGSMTGKALDVGENVVTITVTAEDGLTSKTYTITIIRLAPVCETCTTPLASEVRGTLIWTLCSNGTLIIGGTGTIQNFPAWTSYRSSITRVVICHGITAIGNNAFGDFSSMTSVSIPSTVTSIGNSAFSGCRALVSVEIPASVVTIGNTAFANCSSLTKIVNHAAAPQSIHANNVFDGVNKKTCILYVPDDVSLRAYSVAKGWKELTIRSVDFAEQTGSVFLEGTVSGISASQDSATILLFIRNSNLRSTEGYTLVASIEVSADGQYRFENLPAGVYIMQIVFEDYESPPSESINLTGSATGGNVDFTFDPDTRTATADTPNVFGITGIGELYALEIKVYPNPTSDAITLELDATGTYNLTISDMSGKILLRQTVSDQITRLDLSAYPAGVHLLTIDDGKRQTSTRIVKN